MKLQVFEKDVYQFYAPELEGPWKHKFFLEHVEKEVD